MPSWVHAVLAMQCMFYWFLSHDNTVTRKSLFSVTGTLCLKQIPYEEKKSTFNAVLNY